MKYSHSDRNVRVRIALALMLAVVTAIVLSGCSAQPQSTQEATPAEQPGKAAPVAGLKIVDEIVGKGAEAKNGSAVTVDYTGWLTDGKKFDSSKDRGQPFQFQLGGGNVIPGWDKGVVGMRVGGKRKLTIAPELAYGARGAGGVIPPNATLVFEIELLKVQ